MGRGKFKGKPTGQRRFSSAADILAGTSAAPPRSFKQVYDFGYIYRYLISSPRSFMDSFLHAKETRYNVKMSHVIPEEKWRKGSQVILHYETNIAGFDCTARYVKPEFLLEI